MPADRSSLSLELAAPDIEPYRAGNTGIDYVTTFDSRRPGPHLMISALVHGNELCGAIALDFLFREGIRPQRGKLTLALAYVAAYRRFDPLQPRASRFVDEDLNRLWSARVLDGTRDSLELRRARALRPLLDQADYLLDIHSMQHDCLPLLLCGSTAKGQALAQSLPFDGYIVKDGGHAAGVRMRDYGAFGDPASPRGALLVECGQHWRAASAQVAKATALRFLHRFEQIDTTLLHAYLDAAAVAPARLIEVTAAVTIASAAFRFTRTFGGLELIPKQGSLIALDGQREVRTPYDDCLLIMPSLRLGKGQTAVRLGRFVSVR